MAFQSMPVKRSRFKAITLQLRIPAWIHVCARMMNLNTQLNVIMMYVLWDILM